MARKKKFLRKPKGPAGTAVSSTEEELKKRPHSLVVNRGHIGKNVRILMHDIRRVMEPYTAPNLKVRKKNVLKDFVTIAGPLNVTHLLLLSKTESSTNLRIVRLPRGPTLTFRVNEYSLAKDVISSLKRHNMEPKQFKHHPLLVLNNFSGEGMYIKLMTTMFQNMFPSINVNKIKLADIRRTVLLNYDSETKCIDFRHYNIRAVPVGMGRAVKKLVRSKIPDLHNFQDISDFVVRGGNLSESEGEGDEPQSEVTLPQDVPGRGNIRSAQSAIRLTEIGPRMTLQLVKIEEGVCSGEVLHHEYVKKTEEDLKSLKEFREKKRKLKEMRKMQQAENVKRKAAEKENLKEKCISGMKSEEKEDDGQEDDDTEYFKQEVGTEPEPELFSSVVGKKRKHSERTFIPAKRRKTFNKPRADSAERKSGLHRKDKGRSSKGSSDRPHATSQTKTMKLKKKDSKKSDQGSTNRMKFRNSQAKSHGFKRDSGKKKMKRR